MKPRNGFTMIEIVVVISIIAVLAGIITTSLMQYVDKAKIRRAETDVRNIEKALQLFEAAYNDYPYLPDGDSTFTTFSKRTLWPQGIDSPYLTTNDGIQHFLSEFYKSDWLGYNADYFAQNGYYMVSLFDYNGDEKIGCGLVALLDDLNKLYGYRFILCQDCDCGSLSSQPFSTH